MGRISPGRFESELINQHDKAELRLARRDGQLTTRKHGFLSRAVRALFGATKQDRADNRKIMGDLLAGLKERYGERIGVTAFLEAVPGASFKADGSLDRVPDEKPLTARQVRAAQWAGTTTKMAATTGTSSVVTKLAVSDTSQHSDVLAKGLVSLARVSGTARQQAVKDGVWSASQGEVEKARTAPRGEQGALYKQLKATAGDRYDNAVKLLKAASAMQASAPDHDLVGAAEDLLRKLGQDAGKPGRDVENLINDIRVNRAQTHSQDEINEIANLSNALRQATQSV